MGIQKGNIAAFGVSDAGISSSTYALILLIYVFFLDR